MSHPSGNTPTTCTPTLTMSSFGVENRGTVYRIHLIEVGATKDHMGTRYILTESGWGSNYGEWIALDTDSIHRSYLAEKMPLTWQREGDWEGWKLVFDKAGIEVFG